VASGWRQERRRHLITKDSTNPFFVAMQKGAQADAGKNNVKLTIASGKQEGDDQGQIDAIEQAIARGDKGILITPMSDGVNAAIKKAREAGLFVIALDTPPDPPTPSTSPSPPTTARPESSSASGPSWHARRQEGDHRPPRPLQRQDRLRRLQP
jgi:DNA-binding LacI/PurR family transcriptional regulator